MPDSVILVANGDLRLSANQKCWPAQAQMEEKLIAAFKTEGFTLRRAHPYDPRLGHGFIYNQRMGMDVFMHIHPESPLAISRISAAAMRVGVSTSGIA